MYSWTDVAERTERVYYAAIKVPQVPAVERFRRYVWFRLFLFSPKGNSALMRHGTDISRYYGTGLIFGKMLCLIICVDYILLAFLDFFYPREEIDLAPKFELRKWKEVSSAYACFDG